MKVTYWSDYACPYCYIGHTHLKKSIAELGVQDQVEVEMRAFELDPGASKEYTGATLDRFALKYGLSKEHAAQRIEGISEMGRAAGLDFRYAQTRYTNTFDAHRLTKLAQSKDDATLAERMSERLYAAYFTETLELADPDILRRIAAEEGMDEAEVSELLASDRFADEVRMDEREAARYGIHAVPHFLIGKYAVPGALPVEDMKKVLAEVLDAEKKPEAPVWGMACGPDGCR